MNHKMQKAPGVKVTLVGILTNVYGIIGTVWREIRLAGYVGLAEEYKLRCFRTGGDMDEVMKITKEYVKVVLKKKESQWPKPT